MNTEGFFKKISAYTTLSAEAERDWTGILKEKEYKKGSYFVNIGQVPQKVAFVCEGLFFQYYVTDGGDTVIKHFFPEGRFAGSIPATLTRSGSLLAIEALEHTTVLEYNFHDFKRLVCTYPDVAEFYIRYMEQHWVIEKEPYEISFRNDSAATRYDEFLIKYPDLVKRIKKHHIAAFLGVTPTQLSRIFFANK